MKCYKLSKYNFLVDIKDNTYVYIWNIRTGAIIALREENYQILLKCDFDNPQIVPLMQNLIAQGIVVNSDLDEFNSIVNKSKLHQMNTEYRTLNLIIAPTLSCNYKCFYCFEHNNEIDNSMMTDVTMQQIFAFIAKKIETNHHIENITVTWFGGEPLLAFEKIILPFSTKCIEFCDEHNINYHARIISNGYYLNIDVIEKLFNICRVTSYQITFDGTENTYNMRKQCHGNAYHIVKNNIFELSRYVYRKQLKAQISIRLNADKINYQDLIQFVKEIKTDPKYLPNMKFYLARLEYDSPNIFTLEEFEKRIIDFSKEIDQPISEIREPKLTWCNQYTLGSLCIGPHGELYNCEHFFGNQNYAIGNIFNNENSNEFFKNYFNMPYSSACKECMIFPICLGGCPYKRLQSPDHKNCEYSLQYLNEIAKKRIVSSTIQDNL